MIGDTMGRSSSCSLILHLMALLLVMILVPSCHMDTSRDVLLDAREIVSRYNLDYGVLLYLDASLNKEMQR